MPNFIAISGGKDTFTFSSCKQESHMFRLWQTTKIGKDSKESTKVFKDMFVI